MLASVAGMLVLAADDPRFGSSDAGKPVRALKVHCRVANVGHWHRATTDTGRIVRAEGIFWSKHSGRHFSNCLSLHLYVTSNKALVIGQYRWTQCCKGAFWPGCLLSLMQDWSCRGRKKMCCEISVQDCSLWAGLVLRTLVECLGKKEKYMLDLLVVLHLKQM